MIRVALALTAAVCLLAAGSATGYKVRSWQTTEQFNDCAADIRDQSLKDCPAVIVTAFDAVKGDLAVVQIDYRDRVIPVIVQGREDDRVAREQQSADITALNNVEKTYACAASPAMRLRREQLQRDAEASSAAVAPGGADQDPR